jgi:hypothetical protein
MKSAATFFGLKGPKAPFFWARFPRFGGCAIPARAVFFHFWGIFGKKKAKLGLIRYTRRPPLGKPNQTKLKGQGGPNPPNEMHPCDWSSDVCSSDLARFPRFGGCAIPARAVFCHFWAFFAKKMSKMGP